MPKYKYQEGGGSFDDEPKITKNYAMTAIVACKRMIYRQLSYSIVFANYAIT